MVRAGCVQASHDPKPLDRLKVTMIDYQFCPQCRSQLLQTEPYPSCTVCDIILYRNSKPTAGILLIKDGKVLLGVRKNEPQAGTIGVIGGFLEDGEDPQEGALRELTEETGLTGRITDILGIYMDRYGENGAATLNIHYIGEITGGEMRPSDEIAELIWVPIDQLPTNQGFKNHQDVFEALKKRFGDE